MPSELTLAATLPAPGVSIEIGPPLVNLLFDQPAATDADLVFGANYIAPRDDVTVRATLPLPVVAIKFIPPARAELLAALPGLTVQSLVLRPSVPLNLGAGTGASLPGVVFTGEVRYASHTQRPTVGQTSHHWQVAQQTEDGADHGQQDAATTPAGWETFWRRTLALPQGIEHRLPPVLASLPVQRRTGQQQARRFHDPTWFAHQEGTHLELSRLGLFQNAVRLRDATRFRHQDGDRTKRPGRVGFWQIARLLTQGQGSDYQSTSAARKGWRGRYQDAVPPPPGISIWVVPQPPAPTRHADRCDLDDPRIAVSPRKRRVSRDTVQAGRQVAHVHLCKIDICPVGITQSLPLAVALLVLGPVVAVVAPVVLMALRPRLLGGALVDPVVGIGLELGPLPLALAGTLAAGCGTIGLVGNLRAGHEVHAAASAVLGRHWWAPYKIRMETREQIGYF